MSFMISRETENVQSMSEVVSAFKAITANGDRAYVTEEEIFQVGNIEIDPFPSKHNIQWSPQ